MTQPHCHPAAEAVLEDLRARFPATPFLALGQTALWDEPTKAVWRRLLDALHPDAELIAGVHDTDYFAKTGAFAGSDAPFVLLPHDDGRTRDLWSAAGEMSSLFGSESVPTRAVYEKHGVPFNSLAKADVDGREAFVARETAAWGWRGLVSTRSVQSIAHDIAVVDIKDALLAQMDWAFFESLACLADGPAKDAARETCARVRGWVTGFLETCDANCRLSDLYQTLLPRFYELLLGSVSPSPQPEGPLPNPSPSKQGEGQEKSVLTPLSLSAGGGDGGGGSLLHHFATTSSAELFQFNTQTCSRPRFQLLAPFVNPATRARACAAYDAAVSGSGIYTLDGFGPGAVPFDVVVPAGGRGTLRLTGGGVWVETAGKPTRVSGTPATTVSELAQKIEEFYGPNAALVGKAVTLVDMIAAEFLIVFHETASGYTPLTRTFNDALRSLGVTLDLFPIVRLSYPTWDALSAAPPETVFQLPAHLAAAFGVETITAPDFAGRWRGVVAGQKDLLSQLDELRRPRDLFAFLEGKDDACWCDRSDEYEQALSVLKEIAAHSATLAGREAEHRRELGMWRAERQTLERRMGDDWRVSIEPLREKLAGLTARGADVSGVERELERQMRLRAHVFDEPLRTCKGRIDATRFLLASFRRERRKLERGPEAAAARATVLRLTRDAQRARLRLVRHAFLTIDGLEHTQARPTAWWLPLVDPSGAWLSAIVAGTEARLEGL